MFVETPFSARGIFGSGVSSFLLHPAVRYRGAVEIQSCSSSGLLGRTGFVPISSVVSSVFCFRSLLGITCCDGLRLLRYGGLWLLPEAPCTRRLLPFPSCFPLPAALPPSVLACILGAFVRGITCSSLFPHGNSVASLSLI